MATARCGCASREAKIGLGDELLGSGLAKGSARFNKRVAFGDGKRIHWHGHAYEIFKGNPNVAPPGSEGCGDLDWLIHYSGRRAYCRLEKGHWIFNPGFKAISGEIYLSEPERDWARAYGHADVLIEPNVKNRAPNKQWPIERYQEVANRLLSLGCEIAQFATGPNRLDGVRVIQTPSFRHACASMEGARVYVGPEGGLHHAAAAVGTNAVVIFGGFISPKVTGYDEHTNFFTGIDLGCGNITPCGHCRQCLNKISVEEVYGAASLLMG